MKIKITDISKKDTYISILKHLNIVDDWKLTDNEISIFGSMCYKLTELLKNNVSYDDANVIIFNKEFKEEMCKELNTTNNTYANSLSKLRKLELIKDNKVEKKMLYNIPKKFELIISYEEMQQV